MRIDKIECLPVTSTFRKPFPMGGGAEKGAAGVVIKMYTDEGIVGIADTGGTSAWYRGESQDSIMSMINNVFGPAILLGEDPFNIEKIVARMDTAARDNNQAKAVVDYGLHDIVGKALGVPVYKLLGGLTTEKIPLGFVLPAASTDEVVSIGMEAVRAGFGVLKLKVGFGTDEDDIANVKALREAAGDGVQLFIDSNGSWNYYQALMILKKLEKYDLAMVEQPRHAIHIPPRHGLLYHGEAAPEDRRSCVCGRVRRRVEAPDGDRPEECGGWVLHQDTEGRRAAESPEMGLHCQSGRSSRDLRLYDGVGSRSRGLYPPPGGG